MNTHVYNGTHSYTYTHGHGHAGWEKDRRPPPLKLNYKSSLQIYMYICIYTKNTGRLAGWQADTYAISNRAYHLCVYHLSVLCIHITHSILYVLISLGFCLFVCFQKKKIRGRRRKRNVLLFAFLSALSLAIILISFIAALKDWRNTIQNSDIHHITK